MTIDPETIKAGDKITVEFTVDRMNNDSIETTSQNFLNFSFFGKSTKLVSVRKAPRIWKTLEVLNLNGNKLRVLCADGDYLVVVNDTKKMAPYSLHLPTYQKALEEQNQ